MISQNTLILALAASASAHIVMLNPVPFADNTLNNSPLTLEEFPCKKRDGMYTINKQVNQWNAGETQVVEFMGTAVHGGGSCQFSITTDPEPSQQSQWKVIQSVIGSCPTNHPANLGNDANALVANKFPVEMPSNIPDGRYTFAWTWLNNVGQREFYMNCAPIQVGTGSGSPSTESAAKVLSALPDMFVINLPNTECSTTSSTDFVYPNPGQNVVMNSTAKLDHELNGPGCAKQNMLGAGAGTIGSPSPGTPSTPSQSTTPSKPSSIPSQSSDSQPPVVIPGPPSKASGAPAKPSISQKPVASPDSGSGYPQQSKIPSNPNGGQFAPIASSTLAAVPTPQPSAPAAAQPSPATPQTPSDNNTTPANGDCTPCTNEGGVVCIGSKQFGLCNRGCAVAQDLAAGMACTGGAVVASTKRHVHFPRGHLHRRFTAAHVL